MKKYRSCPHCESEDSSITLLEFTEKYLKDRHTYDIDELNFWLSTSSERKIDIVKCKNCSMIYTKNIIDFKEMLNTLSRPLNKPLNQEAFKEVYEKVTPTKLQISIHTVLQLLKLLQNKKNIRILDFGGGNAGVHSRIANFFGNSYCCTYDVTIEEAEIEGVKYLNNKEKLLEEGPFDLIFCNEVLEHCLHPKKEIEFIYKLLKKDAIAILSVPLFNYNRLNKYKKDILNEKGWAFKNFHLGHINYYSPSLFVKNLKLINFKILPIYIDFRFSRFYTNNDKKIFLRFLEYIIRYSFFRFSLFFNFFPNISNIVNSNFIVRK